MIRDIREFIIDIIKIILNIDIEFVKNPSCYNIFANSTFPSLSIQNYLKEMEDSNEFQYGFYYCMHTSLKANFTIIPMEKAHNQAENYLIIGPYLAETFSDKMFYKICKENRIRTSNIPVFRAIYTTLPSVNEKQVETIAFSIMKYLLKIECPSKIIKEFNVSTPFLDKMLPTESFHITSDILAKRYKHENLLLAAIFNGDTEEAIKQMSNWNTVTILPKPTAPPIRSWKNLSIVTNTLYRKTVESKDVHPYYLDQVSRKYAILIENATNKQQLDTIHINMIYEYCKLVKQFSLSQYSLTIRKTIDYIHLNLANDLSLDTIAHKIDLAPAYLSSLFKKEVKVTITEFIHRKRCEQAGILLVKTDLSIIHIAEQIGIPDSSYFTYLFKRHYNMTPSQYRKKHKET